MKLFYGKILQSLSEDLVNIARAANGHSLVALLGGHSASKLERGMYCDRSRVSDTREARQRGNWLR